MSKIILSRAALLAPIGTFFMIKTKSMLCACRKDKFGPKEKMIVKALKRMKHSMEIRNFMIKMRSLDLLMSVALKQHHLDLVPHLSSSVIHKSEGDPHTMNQIGLITMNQA